MDFSAGAKERPRLFEKMHARYAGAEATIGAEHQLPMGYVDANDEESMALNLDARRRLNRITRAGANYAGARNAEARTSYRGSALCSDDPRKVEACFGVCCLLLAGLLSSLVLKSKTMATSSARWSGGGSTLADWREGYLDIHQIKAGPAESALLVLPDGTSVLVDAGDQDATFFEARYNNTYRVARPPPGLTCGEVVTKYLEHFGVLSIDYAVVTHFHADHFGYPWPLRRHASTYRPSGIAEVANRIPIKRLLDRGYPDYNFPINLRRNGDRATLNYIAFVDSIVATRNVSAERFEAGRSDQIAPVRKHLNNFRIRNIKRDLEVSFAPDEQPVDIYQRHEILSSPTSPRPRFDENRLSIAMVVEYDRFRYYTGGDNQHGIHAHLKEKSDWTDIDTATPAAQAAGRVDVAKLNHHAQGTPVGFLKLLRPSVVVQASWNSDQPSEESLYLLTSEVPYKSGEADYQPPDVFSTWTAPDTLKTRGIALLKYLSLEGHVLVRVYPPNVTDTSIFRQLFEVFVLNEDYSVKARYGPYQALSAEGISGPSSNRHDHHVPQHRTTEHRMNDQPASRVKTHKTAAAPRRHP